MGVTVISARYFCLKLIQPPSSVLDNGYLSKFHIKINDVFWAVENFYKFIISFIVLPNFIKSCVFITFRHQHVAIADKQIRDTAMFV